MSSERQSRVELLQGTLDLIVLRALATMGPQHAYSLASRLEQVAEHLKLLEDDFLRRGLSPDKARLAARRAFGGVEQAKDVQRDARSFVWLDDLRRDLHHATRLLRRNPVFALTAGISLAIGIGASTVIFTAGNSLLLRTAAGVANPDGLVDVVRSEQGRFGVAPAFYTDYAEFRQRVTTLAAVYAYQLDLDSLSLGLTPNGSGQVGAVRIFSNFVTLNYFEALGVRPVLGQLFSGDGSERPDGPPIVALSHRFWTRRFNSDPTIVGQMLILNGRPVTVVGVAPPDFTGLSVAAPDVW